jgi:hypothetical protein
MPMNSKIHFTTVDIALVSVFCAFWVVLNLTVAPISFRLIGLPIIHDLITFFTFLIVTWATGKFGTTSFVGVVGAIIVSLIGGPPPVIGFAVASVLFDILMIANRHKINMKIYNTATTAVATMVSAYFAGVLIGVLFMSRSLDWALTFWGVWHLIGGIISIAITLPVIGILERANVRKMNSA